MDSWQRRRARAEKRRANADARGAFSDGQRKVPAHAHRKLGQAEALVRGRNLVAQKAQGAETDGCLLRGSIERRDGHQPIDAQMSEFRQTLEEFAEC